jgi:dTDP-4-amino-4,6-dideoxygalactose transaminase
LNGAALSHTETICRLILSLPMHAQLTDGEAHEVGNLVVRWTRQSLDRR